MQSVTMYLSDTCPYCRMAKQLLASRGVQPQEINVDFDPAQRAAMVARTGRRTVPQIYIGERHVGGFDDLAALEHSGDLDALLPSTL
jgi:glutaredoxin 3